MGEVTAEGEAHGEDGVAGAQERRVGGEDGGGPGVRLHIGVLGAEEGFRPVDGEAFGGVDDLAAAVVAGGGVALGVLVGEGRAEGFQHGGRGEVLGGDELEAGGLPGELAEQDVGDLGVLVAKGVCGGCDRHGVLRKRR